MSSRPLLELRRWGSSLEEGKGLRFDIPSGAGSPKVSSCVHTCIEHRARFRLGSSLLKKQERRAGWPGCVLVTHLQEKTCSPGSDRIHSFLVSFFVLVSFLRHRRAKKRPSIPLHDQRQVLQFLL